MSTPIVLNLRINTDGSAAVVGMRNVEEAENRVGVAGKRAGDEVSGGFNRASESVVSCRSIMQDAQRTLLGIAGLRFGADFVRDVVDANNKVQSWRFGLQAATSDQRKAAESLAFVRAESNRLGLDLEDNATTWTRLAAAVKGTKLEGEGAQKIFTGTAEAARTLHLSGAETNQMLTALDQMMSKGTVQAQELKLQLGNVLPGAMHIAADSIGVTTAQLDKMMERGEIVAEDFLPKFAKRLHDLYGATAAEAANSPAAQIARLKNAVFELKAAVGDAGFMALLGQHAVSLTSALTRLVQSGALDVIVRGLLAIGQVSAATFVVNKVLDWTMAQVKAAQASAAAAVAQKAQTIAAAEAAQARVAELRSTLAVVEAARAEEIAKLAVAQADVVMAERHLVAAKAAGTQSFALREVAQAEEALTAARLRQTAVSTELAALGRAQVGVQAQIAAGTIAADAAQAKLVATSGLLGRAWTGLKSAGTTLFGLLGGWIGVAVGAAYGLYTAYDYLTANAEKHEQALKAEVTQIEAATVSLRGYHQEIARGDGLGNLEKETKAYVDSVALLLGKESELTAKKAQLRAAEDDLRVATELSKRGIDETGVGLVIASERVQRMRAEIEPTSKAVDELRATVRLVGGDLGTVVPFVNDLTSSFRQLREASTLGSALAAGTKTLQNFVATARALAADKEGKTIFDELITQGKKAELETEKVRLGVVGYAKAQQQRMLADLAAVGASQQVIDTRKHESDQAIANIAADEAAKDAKKHHKDATKELAQEIEKYNAAQQRTAEFTSRALGAMSPYEAALAKYRTAMIEAVKVGQEYIERAAKIGKADEARAQVKQMLTDVQRAELEQLNRTTTALAKQGDVLGQLRKEYDDQSKLVGLTERERAVEDATRKATDAWLAQAATGRVMKQSLAAVQQGAADLSAQLYDQTEAVKLNREAAQEWAGGWQQAGGSASRLFADVLMRGGSMLKGLRDLAKDTTAQIIEYFARLAVINPILNFAFGGSMVGGLLPTMANAFGGSATPLAQTGANVVGSMVNPATGEALGGAAPGGGGLMSGISSFFSIGKWVDWGKSLWSGFSGGFDKLFGAGAYGGAVNPATGMPTGQGFFAGGSPIGTAANVLGGAFAGWRLGSQLGGTAGGILGAGALGYAAYAFPVVGWIAGIASLLDSLTGGSVFGTKYKPTGNQQSTLSLDNGGFSVANLLEEKKKGALFGLFGGNSTRWTSAPASDEQKDYAKQLYDAIRKLAQTAASALGATVADIVAGSFKQVKDKSGKVTEEMSTVLGKTYVEPMEDFVKRIQGETIIAQINAARNDTAASQVAEGYRKNAATLLDAAKMLLAAQADIKRGQSLLSDSNSLNDIAGIVDKLRQQDESLVDAYARLQTEAQALRDSLALTGADIGKTGKAFVEFADAAAQAAGGADKLVQLMQQFATAFYSPQELAKAQMDATRRQADSALSALGLDPAITRDAFRKLYEAALPTMTPSQMVQWQQAGVLLAGAADAQKAYNDGLRANAIGVQQILDALDPERANRYAGSWRETLDGINKTFDDGIEKLKSLGATAEQLTQAEAGRQKAIDGATKQAQDAYDSIVKQIRDGMRALTQPSSELDAALSAVDDALTATIKQMEEAARRVPGMTGANPSDIDAAKQYADAQKQQIKQRYADMVRDILASLDPDKAASDSVASKLKETNQQFDEAIAKLKAYGATAAQIAQAETDRQRTLGRTAAEFLQGLGIISGGATDFSRALADIAAKESQARAAAEALAVSQGRAGASAAELARIQVWAAEQTAAAAAKLRARRDDLLSQLYGGTPGGLDEVNRRIAELESAARGLGDAAGDASASINAAANAERDRIQFQIGDLSALNDNQKLDIAKDAYLKGQVGREDVAKIAQRLYASSNDYYKVYEWLLANDPKTPTQAGGGGSAGNGSSGELADLYKQRDALLAQQLAEQRKALASELVANLADEAKLRHMDALALMDVLKVDIKSIVKDMGIDIKKIDANGVLGLSNIATTLGVRLSALLGKLGIGFGDLQTGLVELTQRMGVDLERIDATNVRKLADLATMLGIGMRDLLTGLHLNLGDLSLGIEQLVSKLGIDLTNISADNVKSLAKLAGELNLGLDDVVAALHLSMSDLSDGLRELAKQQGVNLQAIDANGVKALSAMATSLNVSLSSLLDGMKLSLKDVAPGLRELTAALGIDLGNLNATNVQALGKLSGQLGTDLGTLVQTLGISLKDIAPGLTKIANDLGINLTALTTADQAKLADLATALHIKLSDIASVLGIKLDGVSGSINANTSRIGVSIDAVAAARLAGDRDLGVRFDGLTRSVNDMRGDQVAVLRSVDSGIAQLPSVIRNSQSTADLATEMRSVRDAIDRTAAFAERQAVVSERMLPAISRSTDDAANSSVRTASATEATAVNTRDTANSVRNGRTMPP